MLRIILIFLFALSRPFLASADSTISTETPEMSLHDRCLAELQKLDGPYDKQQLPNVCAKAEVLAGCHSVKGIPIYHYDKIGEGGDKSKRILAVSLIHGDEFAAGSVSRAWMTRLETIEPRNTWRVIPVMNPDGLKAKTRTNANGVDLNRNFPSKDWNDKALAYWKKNRRSDPRRYPGPSGGSEIETQCLIKHIESFKPDFIISIHTPLGVLDFDGPKIGNPGFRPLPWVSLGNYPGSLGRYMWVDHKIPVLTIELRGNSGLNRLAEFDRLQDITGTVAIQADRLMRKEALEEKEDPKKKEAIKDSSILGDSKTAASVAQEEVE